MGLGSTILSLAVAGSGVWWHELDVSAESLDEWGITAKAVQGVTDALRATDLVVVMDRCQGVVHAGLAAQGRSSPLADDLPSAEDGVQERPAGRDWLICVAAFELVAESRDARFQRQLERLYPVLVASYGGGGESSHGFDLRAALIRSAVTAYGAIMLAELSPAELVAAWREERTRAGAPIERRSAESIEVAAITIAFGQMIKADWGPEMLALYRDTDSRVRRGILLRVPAGSVPKEAHADFVNLLIDEDGAVRDLAERRLLGAPEQSRDLAPAILSLLRREDLDDRAVDVATRALHARGYHVESTPAGLRTIPRSGTEPDGPVTPGEPAPRRQ